MKGGLNAFAKTVDSCQPAQSANCVHQICFSPESNIG